MFTACSVAALGAFNPSSRCASLEPAAGMASSEGVEASLGAVALGSESSAMREGIMKTKMTGCLILPSGHLSFWALPSFLPATDRPTQRDLHAQPSPARCTIFSTLCWSGLRSCLLQRCRWGCCHPHQEHRCLYFARVLAPCCAGIVCQVWKW